MNVLDRIIGYVSPTAGLRRAQARKVLQRSYAGAESNRLTSGTKPKNQSADQELMGPYGADAMRAWARSMVRNNAYAWNVVDTIVSNVIGDGITLQSVYETKDGEDVEDVNESREKLWAEWCEVADINGQLTFAEIQVIAQREIVEAGEVLIRKIRTPGKEYRGITRPVPLALELIEADRLSLERDTYKSSMARAEGNRVVRGIEVDQKGRPVAYWIYQQHPNSPYSVGNQVPERVPADEVIHLFRLDRIGQTRGVSWFAPVMSPMRDLGIYIDNELQASAVASCFGVVVKTNTPSRGLQNPTGDESTDNNGNTLEYLEPGMVTRIGVEESIEVINPSRPNSAAEPWISLMLRGIAAGTGTNYEAVAKDFSNTSYSSSRTSKLEDRTRYKRWQNYMVWHLCQPVWDEFCNKAAVVNAENFPTSSELLEDRRGVAPVEWQLPEQEWVDPAAEQTAAQQSIDRYMSTYQDELGSRGRSWRATFYQASKEKKLRMKLGLLTSEEQTAQMMAAQTGASGPADEVRAEEDAEGATGEWMGLSRLQWNRNRKALQDVLNGLSDGSMSPALARAQLSMIGLTEKNIEAIVADASDGTVDNPIPAEDVASE
ncbi:Phage portal protein, lambda family [Pirellula sp. SH-Sr6A]|uniref:phage portal protein n=1 Tax=Pirellula sp. SH-Sr6A TaxID=1632865 RepID=UPI00078CAE60|nr:phage portal protein [Pirellula sp. SH-Sr6A]AMV30905.1 Phage portal protein, lambda family [Pirellula sp. SH-Sr6A]AMV34335.1 Phage portal protein, lambda family [Pirellula sp. SH-Sr6A]